MFLRWIKVAILLLAVISVLPVKALELTALQEKFRKNSAVAVYKLQYDERGEISPAIGVYCSSCNGMHENNLAELLEERRDLELNAFVVAPDKVLIPNVCIDPLAVKSLIVIKGKHRIKASVSAIYPDHGVLLLTLEKPLPECEPLKFTAYKPGEILYSYSRICEEGRWVSRVKAFDPAASQEINPAGEKLHSMPGFSLLLNKAGEPVTISGNCNGTESNGDWAKTFTQWKSIPWEKFEQDRSLLMRELKNSLIPVTVYFNEQKISRRNRLQHGEAPLEVSSFAFVMPGGQLVMPLLLTPVQHGLIKSVILHLPGGDMDAYVMGIMKNFGVIVLSPRGRIRLPAVAPAVGTLEAYNGQLVWGVRVNVYTRHLEFQVYCDALGAVVRGYRQCSFGSGVKNPGSETFFFTLDGGKLLGVNTLMRTFDYQNPLPLLDASDLAARLNSNSECLSPDVMSNSAGQTADMGIEYQTMNPELAKSVNLEHISRNGSEGLLVSYVYPGSTAEKIGLKAGDVLLKLLLPDGGKPIRLESRSYAGDEEVQFPWEELDRIPEMYFSEIPEPWKGVKNPLNTRLSTIGIGKKLELIAVCGGKLVRKEFEIAAAPVYYEIAAAYSSDAWGWEVRNMTYEVLRYFRMEKEKAGVIVADVFAGSPAATAGLRPFEIITAVNDKRVHNIDEFKAAVSGAAEVRLTVRRLAAERVVTVKPKTGPRL